MQLASVSKLLTRTVRASGDLLDRIREWEIG